jgi:diguanylate cyclase (GGDEF)-like protein
VPQCDSISRRRSILFAITLALFAGSALARSPVERDPPSPRTQKTADAETLRTLTTLRQAHSLSSDEARRGYPVHVRAVVTYYDSHVDSRRLAFFLHDSTGSIYAAVLLGTTWPGRQPVPGTLVDVTGVTAPGDYAPIIDQARITVLGDAQLPNATSPVTLPTLLTGADDARWVEIDGVVHSVTESATNVTLQVAMDGGVIAATTVQSPSFDYHQLVDKWVQIRGNAAPIFNANSQLTGARLFFPGMETVFAVAPDSGDAFARPVRPVDGLLRFDPSNLWPHRVHVRGAVTLFWPGRTLCIKDATGGLCAQTTQTTPLAPGWSVDLVGFTVLSGFKPALSDAIFRPLAGNAAVAASPVTPEQALDGKLDSDLVQIDGRLIGRDEAASDANLIVSSGKFLFRVLLPTAVSEDAKISAIPIGSKLRITGICSVQVDNESTLRGFGFTQASHFSIMLRSPQDIVVLQRPSLWTVSRIEFVLLFTLVVTVAGFMWAFSLRSRVEQQTRELRQSRELYRHMAHHDSLTGLATRTLLHDRLQVALDRAQRFHKSIALLMLDLDKFKPINDYFGHSAGDEVLRVTARRIRATIRKTDSVARMGGDEFIVLLNDLTDAEQAEQIAAKIVAALSEPIEVGKFQIPISVSIGVCTLEDETVDAEVLLRRVDAAMYRAKACGRGCFQVFTGDLVAAMRSQSPDAHPSENPSPRGAGVGAGRSSG